MEDNIKDRYQYVTNSDQTIEAVGIVGGKFDGMVIKYGEVHLPKKENEEGYVPFKFDYDILNLNGIDRDTLDEEFYNLIGDILISIIDEHVEHRTLGYKSDN